MQPALIRIIDNIRKQLEHSQWRGDYENVHRWPTGTSVEVQTQVLALQQELETATPDRAVVIQRSLDQLPRPYPGYELKLTHGEHSVRVDLWQLCYQVCCIDYAGAAEDEAIAHIDTSLIDMDAQDLDWHRIDEKAKQLVEQVFANLPIASA